MWKPILDAVCKNLSSDPKIVEEIIKIDKGFEKWVQYYNPNDIGTINEKEKIVVQFLSEDLQDLKMRGAYFVYLAKKSQVYRLAALWSFFNDITNAYFWVAIRAKYKLWDYESLGVRDGFKIVVIPPCSNELPDVLRRLFGG